ncbi:serum paraoxonase/arylesterase 2-like isoform X1 [Babylonia areolata]|uniref:serum paraoxonase/arylesterase 2-like isoform X1 n=1 Tax=Babylonia areolata TaxID=304850 RepID=UPI003FD161DB
MLSRGTCVKIVVVSLLAVTAQHVARFMVHVGMFSHFFKHYPGPCKKVENIQPGSEDFYTLPDGLTFISSGFREQCMGPSIDEHFRQHKIKGRIYLFDFKKVNEGVKELKIASTEKFNADTFHPHGISVWEDKKAGHHVVFVVNHPHEQPVADRIEKFIFDPDKLELNHHSYYSGEALKVVSDVVAVSGSSFYVSNMFSEHSWGRMVVEVLGLLPWASLVFCEHSLCQEVAIGLMGACGLATSVVGDQQYIYVAAALGREIRVYRRNPDNSLRLQQIFPLHTFPDNIQVDHKTGDLYAGCHPIGHKILVHLDSPMGNPSPSQVLQLKVQDGNITSVQELFYDHGELISASTSATVYNRKLLIGSIFHNLVTCDVDVPL